MNLFFFFIYSQYIVYRHEWNTPKALDQGSQEKLKIIWLACLSESLNKGDNTIQIDLSVPVYNRHLYISITGDWHTNK